VRRHQSTEEHESIGKKNGGKGGGWVGGVTPPAPTSFNRSHIFLKFVMTTSTLKTLCMKLIDSRQSHCYFIEECVLCCVRVLRFFIYKYLMRTIQRETGYAETNSKILHILVV
jgi:hypothetical protein